MTSETDEQFVERMDHKFANNDYLSMTDDEGDRLFALARRGAGLTLDRQRIVVREDHSRWIRETYSRYVPLPPPPAGETNE